MAEQWSSCPVDSSLNTVQCPEQYVRARLKTLYIVEDQPSVDTYSQIAEGLASRQFPTAVVRLKTYCFSAACRVRCLHFRGTANPKLAYAWYY